jgi:hypothetical protein
VARRSDPPPQRRRVDLFRLPAATRNALALAVVAVVVALAWWVGGDQPVPGWVSDGLIPALGWLVLALAAWRLVAWLRRRRGARRNL